MLREQKTGQAGYLSEDRLETEDNRGVRSIAAPDNERKDGATSLLEQLLSRDNLNAAYIRVLRNKGASGVDGMTVYEMHAYLVKHKAEIIEAIRNGKYKPKPVRRVEIPKPDGGIRQLGVPTVIDRLIQQGLVQVLQPIFEKTFSDGSYGFRPKRSAHQAIQKAKEYYVQGYKQAVDIDLAKYFDTVNHDLLIKMVRREVKDEGVIALIKAFLKSGVMTNGIVKMTNEGTPQGGNLSPLLSNIYLSRLDKELEKRGHKFVRYADDLVIYVKTRRAAERVMGSVTKFLEGKLKLKVNAEKSRVGSPVRFKFLGFSLYQMKGKAGIRVHQKSLEKFKKRVKQITSRKRGRSIEQVLYELNEYTTGWINYFGVADVKSKTNDLTEWIRRRLRMYIWKQWKKPKTRYQNLEQLGTSCSNAYQWSYTRKGYWHIAKSWVLTTTLTNKYLEALGYKDIAKRFEIVHLNY